MTAELLLTVTAASLLGSLHCAGMCGGLAAFASSGDPTRAEAGGCAPQRLRTGCGRAAAHSVAAYNAGRLLAYLALGALAGSLGAGLDAAGQLAGFGRFATVMSGLLMVLWGILHLTRLAWILKAPEAWSAPFSKLLGWASAAPNQLKAWLVGLATGLLPCGWLYAFVIAAAGTGSVGGGLLVLFAFWLGTLPVMVGLGSMTRLLGDALRRRLPVLSALVVLTLGFTSLYYHYNVPAAALNGLTNMNPGNSLVPEPGQACH